MYVEIPKPRTKAQVKKELMEVDDSRGAELDKQVEMIYKYEQTRYKELVEAERIKNS